MPTIAQMLIYEVQKINRIEETPCMIAPCGHCRGIHVFPLGTSEFVASQCPPHGPAFEGRRRPDFHSLIHGGPALRQLVLVFETEKDMRGHLEMLESLQPRELWQEIQTLDYDPTTVPNPFAGDLDAQRDMGDAFDESTMKLTPFLDKLVGEDADKNSEREDDD